VLAARQRALARAIDEQALLLKTDLAHGRTQKREIAWSHKWLQRMPETIFANRVNEDDESDGVSVDGIK
jgi:hypothetical protein